MEIYSFTLWKVLVQMLWSGWRYAGWLYFFLVYVWMGENNLFCVIGSVHSLIEWLLAVKVISVYGVF